MWFLFESFSVNVWFIASVVTLYENCVTTADVSVTSTRSWYLRIVPPPSYGAALTSTWTWVGSASCVTVGGLGLPGGAFSVTMQ